jgi:glutaminyl-peptide cyclotransferase
MTKCSIFFQRCGAVVALQVLGALINFTCAAEQVAAPQLRYAIVASYPHDAEDFTEGLELAGDALLESAGRYGESKLCLKSLKSGVARRCVQLPHEYFGEGVTQFGEYFFQLTWRERTALVYDTALKLRRKIIFDGEGWGLTHDDIHLILSDGTDRLGFLDAENFRRVRTVLVNDHGKSVSQLNELEYARGLIFANVWTTDLIAVIAPRSGDVVAWLDLSALKQKFEKPLAWDAREHVLNGIAYDPRNGHFYVTGKCWPAVFEIELDKWPGSP